MVLVKHSPGEREKPQLWSHITTNYVPLAGRSNSACVGLLKSYTLGIVKRPLSRNARGKAPSRRSAICRSALYYKKSCMRELTVCSGQVTEIRTLPYGISRSYGKFNRFPNNFNDKEDGVQPHETEQGGPAVQIAGTTQLQEDETTVAVTPIHHVTLLDRLKPNNRLDMNYIAEWFAKPFRLQSGVFQATDTANTFAPFSYPRDIINDTYYAEKIKGFRYWRGDCTMTLQVNASKFCAGIYKLLYIPYYGHISANNTSNWYQMHSFTSYQRSQNPGVIIDIARETSVSFKIPFVGPMTGIPFGASMDNGYNLGYLRLVPFSPYNTGSGQDSTCGYTLWASFENVELFTPAGPQSGVTPAVNEQKSKNIGPVQSVATGLRDTAVSLSAVPALTPFAAPAAFFLDITSKVASSFGWSKPPNLDVETKVVRDVMYNNNHFNSSDNSRILSLDEKNMVEILPGFAGTDVDELNFEVFLSRPTLIDKFLWTTSDSANTIITTKAVTPNVFRNDIVDGLTVTSYTPMSYMCNLFNYWRGDIYYKFQFVTTTMHSGRMAFFFFPIIEDAVSLSPVVNAQYAFRRIVDLRETNEVTIAVPFTAVSQYRRTYDTGLTNASAIGLMEVYIVDELVCPNTAPLSVEVLVWSWAGPGFEFAVPKGNTLVPVMGQAIVPTPQSGVDFLGNSNPIYDETCEASRKCIGERVTSLRQLLRTCKPMQRTVTSYSGNSAAVRPFVAPIAVRAAGATTESSYQGDLYTQLLSMFALSRGGVRLKLIPDGGASAVFKENFIMLHEKSNGGFDINSDLRFSSFEVGYFGSNNNENNIWPGANVIFTDTATRFGFEVAVPFYCQFMSRSNSQLISADRNGNGAPDNRMGSCDYLIFNTGGSLISIMRGGADDFNLGQFVSIPPMTVFVQSPVV